jgi:hypothetical protein
MSSATERFPIRFDAWFRVMASWLLLAPSRSFIDVDDNSVSVHVSWGFEAYFPRHAVSAASPTDLAPISRGVHGFAGTWLVNGSGRGIVELLLEPRQRARVMGFPVSLRKLLVSVDDPSALVARLQRT